MQKIIAETKTQNVWLINDQIFIAPKYSTIDSQGNPTAARWECSKSHWDTYRKTAYPNFLDI